MRSVILPALFLTALSASAASTANDISFVLTLDHERYMAGERINGTVSVVNRSSEPLSVGYADSKDDVVLALYRADDPEPIAPVRKTPFVSRFKLGLEKSIRLGTILNSHFDFPEPLGSADAVYHVQPGLSHRGKLDYGDKAVFTVSRGTHVHRKVQTFGDDGLTRDLQLRVLQRRNRQGILQQELFLLTKDVRKTASGATTKVWPLRAFGTSSPNVNGMEPSISFLRPGSVTIRHPYRGSDHLTEFTSTPDAFRCEGTLTMPFNGGHWTFSSAEYAALWKQRHPGEKPHDYVIAGDKE